MKNLKWYWWAVIALTVIGAGVGAWFIFKKDDKDDAQNKDKKEPQLAAQQPTAAPTVTPAPRTDAPQRPPNQPPPRVKPLSDLKVVTPKATSLANLAEKGTVSNFDGNDEPEVMDLDLTEVDFSGNKEFTNLVA